MRESEKSKVNASDKRKMVLKLEANDQTVIEVEEDVAFQCRLIKQMLSDLGITNPDHPGLMESLRVTNVNGRTLQKIIDWCTEHRGEEYTPKAQFEDPRITLTLNDEEWMDVPGEELVELLMGANYLDIPGIIDIITQKIANMAIGKSVEEIRKIYCLDNDFTPEEEKQLRMDYNWIEL